jgi:hypothetical protein
VARQGLIAAAGILLVVLAYVQRLSMPHPHAEPLFPLLFTGAMGAVFIYPALASLVNRTDVIVTLAGAQVRIYPLPWPGNKIVPAQEISDVIVRERSSYNRQYAMTYAVMYAGESRKEQRLVSFRQRDQAEYVANAIRAALNIKANERETEDDS